MHKTDIFLFPKISSCHLLHNNNRMDRLDSGGTASNSSCSLDQDVSQDKADLTAAAKNCVYTFSDNCDSDEEDLKYKNKLNTHGKSSITEQFKHHHHHQQQFLLDKNATIGSEGNSSGGEPLNHPAIYDQKSLVKIESDANVDNDDDKQIINTASTVIDNPTIDNVVVQPPQSTAPRVRRIANGSIPKSGKPMSYAMERKANSRSTSKVRGRPKRKALFAMYQSQITDNQIGIKLKLKLKKSSSASTSPSRTTAAATTATATTVEHNPAASNRRTAAKANNRKRSKKPRRTSDSEDSDYKKRRRKQSVNNNSLKKGESIDDTATADEPQEQSPWGCGIPENVLFQIFENAVRQESSLPTLVRLGKVCSLWNKVSLSRSLWCNVDFSAWTKERNELLLKWLIDNRLGQTCEDVNLGERTFYFV